MRIYIYAVVEINISHPHEIVNNFLITAQIPLKICVWFLDPSIHIRFYNKAQSKKNY